MPLIDDPAVLLLLSAAVSAPAGAVAAVLVLRRRGLGEAQPDTEPATRDAGICDGAVDDAIESALSAQAEEMDDRLFQIRAQLSEVAAILRRLSRSQAASDRAAVRRCGDTEESVRRLQDDLTRQTDRLGALEAHIEGIDRRVADLEGRPANPPCAICDPAIDARGRLTEVIKVPPRQGNMEASA